MRRLLPLLPAVLVAAACGGGGGSTAASAPASTPATTAAAKKSLQVDLTAQSHHPKLGQPWTYQVHVTDAQTGEPVAAHVHLQFFFGSMPVGEVGQHDVANGVWKETIPATGPDAFPEASVGQKVTLRATATAPGYAAAHDDWAVEAVR